MRLQDNYSNKGKKNLVIMFCFLLISLFFVLYFKINKFEFSGDINFVDSRRLKILSLNYLKDQSIFWFNKNLYENEIKNEFPQIKALSYKIINSNTLEIFIDAEDMCCIIQDSNDKQYIISTDGRVLRDYEGNYKSEVKNKTPIKLQVGESLNLGLIKVLSLLSNQEIKIDDIQGNTFYLENDLIYFYTQESKQILINGNTNFEKINQNLKSMKSFLQQNQKNYSILDFRFEKIVVK